MEQCIINTSSDFKFPPELLSKCQWFKRKAISSDQNRFFLTSKMLLMENNAHKL